MTWRAVARTQPSVISRAQLLASGLSNRDCDVLRSRGELVPYRHRGIWRVAAAQPAELTPAWAAVLATGGVLSHLSAAAAWGMLHRVDGPTHILLPAGRRSRLAGIRTHRLDSATLDIVSIDGLPITDRPRTVLDCLPLMSPERAATLLDRALQQRWVIASDVADRIEREAGRAGSLRLRELAAQLGSSAAERAFHALLRRAGIRGWRANAPLVIGRTTYEIDVLFAGARLAIEIDGWAFHHEVERFRADRRRQNALINNDWRVLRFTWDDIRFRPDHVIATVRTALAAAPR